MTEKLTTRATVASWSIAYSGVCTECGRELSRTYGSELFPWYHSGTGSETCEG